MKFEKIRACFLPETDAALFMSQTLRRYLTGFDASDGLLLVSADKVVLFMDSRYLEAAQKQVTCCDEIVLFENYEKSLLPFLSENGIHSVVTESDRMNVTQLLVLQEVCKEITVKAARALDACVDALREVKSQQELDKIKKAQKIAENAFDVVCALIRPGVTEREIALKLDFEMLSHGAKGLSFETIAVSGPNSSLPHGVPGERKIEKGDFVTMDFGAVVDGYHSDMTRTVAVGKVDTLQKKVYQTVLLAQQEALQGMKAGISCQDIDNLAREVIKAEGFGAYFGHGLGHGVGMEIHEKPNLSPRSKGILRVGNVVTNEPGIYLPGQFGVRIEDMIAITGDGFENLTRCEKQLRIL